MDRKELSTLISLSLLSLWIAGCLPASRISHKSNRSTDDAELLQDANADAELSTSRRKVLIAAEEWLGTPYVYGGASRSGTDCSGFVLNVFKKIDVELPRTSQEQSNQGVKIAIESILPGDLLFFNTSGSGVSHVGISIGEKRFVHASTSRGVIVSSLEENYYSKHFMFAKRIL
ncbi:MAG: C40 family peptidase [Ignavibacteriae bacterium]|nr:C40 family peptidase [Ignavibacteriota bacterium]